MSPADSHDHCAAPTPPEGFWGFVNTHRHRINGILLAGGLLYFGIQGLIQQHQAESLRRKLQETCALIQRGESLVTPQGADRGVLLGRGPFTDRLITTILVCKDRLGVPINEVQACESMKATAQIVLPQRDAGTVDCAEVVFRNRTQSSPPQ